MALWREDPRENELPLELQVAHVCVGSLQNVWILSGKWHQHISGWLFRGKRGALGSLEDVQRI